MQHTKETKRLRIGWRAGWPVVAAMLAVAGMHAAPAQAQRYDLLNTCGVVDAGPPEYIPFKCTGEAGARTCWCEVDWDYGGTWQLCILYQGSCATYEDPPTSTPDEATDTVYITHSTSDSRCDEGPNHGKLCTADGDCDRCEGGTRDGISCAGPGATKCTGGGGTCSGNDCESEQYLVINLVDETVQDITIKTESGASQTLDLRFASKGDPPAAKTMTAGTVTIDGVNGAVTVSVKDAATLETQ